MRILSETHIDFLGWRKVAFLVSGLAIAAGMASLIANGGPRLGIDFAGGSQIVVRFADAPDLDALREALAAEGLEATIQQFEVESNEILIRTPGTLAEDQAADEIDTAVAAVRTALAKLHGEPEPGILDLNNVDPDEVVSLLLQSNPRGYDLEAEPDAARDAYREAVTPLFRAKAEGGLLSSWQQVEATGVDPEILAAIRDAVTLGDYAVINSESVGPQVGRDLRSQAIQAIVWALLGMLAYISYRFEFKFGVAAVAALVHDVLVALGAFSITGREFNLPVIAAFLTIVGYSLNDTVVVFDRVRENATAMRRTSLYERFNISLNQTLSRTLLTSTTTLIVVACLYLYGGPVINDFSFALLVGVVVGTYSSLYIASPIVYLWQQRDLSRRR